MLPVFLTANCLSLWAVSSVRLKPTLGQKKKTMGASRWRQASAGGPGMNLQTLILARIKQH